LEKFSIKEGDVLVCEGGEAGRAAVWKGPDRGIKFQKAIHRVRCGPDLYNRFFVHRLMYDYFSGGLADYYTGTTIKHFTGQDLARYLFAIPVCDEQRRIAAILDQADALRRKRRTAIDGLRSLQLALFYDIFGDPATNPKRLSIGTIGDLTESTQYGTSARAGDAGASPILRMGNITSDGDWDLADMKFIDLPAKELDKYTVRSGDILFNRTNSAELVGKTAVFHEDEPYAFAGYLVRLRVNGKADPEYISSYLNSPYGKTILRGMCRSIIGMANINAKELRSIDIPIPPVELQQKFAQHCRNVRKSKEKQLSHLAELNALFTSLQDRAFRGEL
jgi:type I restriction enzyme S subunit